MTTKKPATRQLLSKTSAKPAEPLPASRRWLFRLISLFTVAVVLPLLGELGLRVAGYGYSTGFFKRCRIGERECLVDNDEFGFRFFPPELARFPAPVVMDATKAQGTFRIFIFGESAALGDPQPNFGAGRYLDALLRDRFPEGKFEVVNTGVTAINSHVIREIARECKGMQGDCWIVYMGNNEMVGPFGAATVFGRQAPPLSVVRLTLAIQKTRLGQWLVQLSGKIRGSSRGASWHGMEMFLRNKVPPNDPRRERVCRNFQANLEDILQAGSQAGGRTVLNTVAVNLADCAPFASLSVQEVPAPQRTVYEQARTEGLRAAGNGDWAGAAENFRRAVVACPESAEAHFRLAECLLALTNTTDAAGHFIAAADNDVLPFRADSRLNGIIRKAAAAHAQDAALTLCDTAVLMATNSPSGVPGRESFFEHVHLNFAGNYHLALFWAEQVTKCLPPTFMHGAAAVWATRERCEELLGLTDWNRLSTIEEMAGRLKQPPFTEQPGNERRLAEFQAWTDDLKQRTGTNAVEHARAVYLEALRRSPDDYRLHQNYAEFLEATGAREQAAAELRKVCELIPHYYFPYYQLGCSLKRQGKVPEAREQLLKAAALNPRSGEVHLELGMVYGRSSEWDLALREFAQARRLSPEDPRVLLYAGEVLRKLNRRPEAVESFRAAIGLKGDYWEAHYRLGEEFGVQRQFVEALEEFQRTIQIKPDYVKGYVSLAATLLELRRVEEAGRQLDKALSIDPQNVEALMLRTRIRSAGSR